MEDSLGARRRTAATATELAIADALHSRTLPSFVFSLLSWKQKCEIQRREVPKCFAPSFRDIELRAKHLNEVLVKRTREVPEWFAPSTGSWIACHFGGHCWFWHRWVCFLFSLSSFFPPPYYHHNKHNFIPLPSLNSNCSELQVIDSKSFHVDPGGREICQPELAWKEPLPIKESLLRSFLGKIVKMAILRKNKKHLLALLQNIEIYWQILKKTVFINCLLEIEQNSVKRAHESVGSLLIQSELKKNPWSSGPLLG